MVVKNEVAITKSRCKGVTDHKGEERNEINTISKTCAHMYTNYPTDDFLQKSKINKIKYVISYWILSSC